MSGEATSNKPEIASALACSSLRRRQSTTPGIGTGGCRLSATQASMHSLAIASDKNEKLFPVEISKTLADGGANWHKNQRSDNEKSLMHPPVRSFPTNIRSQHIIMVSNLSPTTPLPRLPPPRFPSPLGDPWSLTQPPT